MSIEQLQDQQIYEIMFHLSTQDVLRCMQVCRHLQTVLSDKYFWKKFIHHRFDLTSTDQYDGPLYQWANREYWFCYFANEDEDSYVLRPFPTMWKCGVAVPAGLDYVSPHIKYLQGLSRALEILVRMKEGIKSFHLSCGNECSGNEGANDISVVLFPWEKDELPEAGTVLREIFHFHPEVCGDADTTDYGEKLYFHLEDDPEHEDPEEEPCLNQVFGTSSYSILSGAPHVFKLEYATKEEFLHKQTEYFSWLQRIMIPTRRIITGEMKLNPVIDFFITTLAPGWVGGALTGQTWT